MIYSVSQFIPKNPNVPNYGKWSVMQQIAHLPAGIHEMIDGKSAYTPGVIAWEHVPGVPWFNTEREAKEVMVELKKLN